VQRRAFMGVLASGLLAAPLAVEAQRTAKVYRVGYLGGSLAGRVHGGFEPSLVERGWIPGQNIIIEYRWYEGSPDRAQDLARELLRLRLDLVVTVGPFGAMAMKDATSSLPHVFTLAGDPVRTGLVASLSHPGGNRTGIAYDPTPEVAGKPVQFLKEMVPSARRIGVLWNDRSADTEPYLREVKKAAQASALSTVEIPVRVAEDFEPALAAMTKADVQALVVIPDPMTVVFQQQLVTIVARHRLPAVYQFKQSVEAGGLLSYGPSAPAQVSRAAYYVDKILRGSKPGDLPVEQPTKFELVINLKTAKALGLTIPQSVLLRADQVIE